MKITKDAKLVVVGLGYVGLPLAIPFAQKYETIGFDLKQPIVSNFLVHKDSTGEVSKSEFEKAVHFIPTTDPKLMSEADIIIVLCPPPLTRPDGLTFSLWKVPHPLWGKS